MPIELPHANQLSDEVLGAMRLRALRGVELGYTQTDLAELLGVRQETISRWWTAYRAEGTDALPGRRTGRPQGSGRMLSDEQADRVKALIDAKFPRELGLAQHLNLLRIDRQVINIFHGANPYFPSVILK